MTRRLAGAAEWELVEDEADDRALGPEDYAWLALIEDARQPERLPRLTWVWDLGEREVREHLIAVAAQGPFGSA